MSEPLLVEVTGTDTQAAPVTQANGRLAPHQFDFVAMSFTNGVPLEEVARAVGTDTAYLRYLSNRHNESFNRIWDGYKNNLLNATVSWRFRLAKMLDLGYQAIETALTQTRDPKLAADQAWKLLEAVVPESRVQANAGPAVQVNFGANTQVQAQLADTLQNVFASFASLKASMSTDAPDTHIKQGADAIIQVGIPDVASSTDAPLTSESFGETVGSTQ